MSDIFISYARKDKNKVRTLAKALEAHGFSVWWDTKLRIGERFDDRIEQAIEEAKLVIVVWSIHSKRSKYVKDESSFAEKYNKLIPVAIEKVEPPLRFQRIQTQQLSDWDGSDNFPPFQKLVNDIADYIKDEKKKVEYSSLYSLDRKYARIMEEAKKLIEDNNRLIERIFRD
jgi:hypothetical protein